MLQKLHSTFDVVCLAMASHRSVMCRRPIQTASNSRQIWILDKSSKVWLADSFFFFGLNLSNVERRRWCFSYRCIWCEPRLIRALQGVFINITPYHVKYWNVSYRLEIKCHSSSISSKRMLLDVYLAMTLFAVEIFVFRYGIKAMIWNWFCVHAKLS